MSKKPNDFWLWVLLIVALPLLVISVFVGGWLQDMSLWDRAKVIVPITVLAIWLAVGRK